MVTATATERLRESAADAPEVMGEDQDVRAYDRGRNGGQRGILPWQRATVKPGTPGMGTSSQSECRKASGCAARDARRPSFASKSMKIWASALTAIIIFPSRHPSASTSSSTRTPSKSGTRVCSRLILLASTIGAPIRNASWPSKSELAWPKPPSSARDSSRASASSSGSPTAASSWGAWARSSAKN